MTKQTFFEKVKTTLYWVTAIFWYGPYIWYTETKSGYKAIGLLITLSVYSTTALFLVLLIGGSAVLIPLVNAVGQLLEQDLSAVAAGLASFGVLVDLFISFTWGISCFLPIAAVVSFVYYLIHASNQAEA